MKREKNLNGMIFWGLHTTVPSVEMEGSELRGKPVKIT